MRLCGGEKMHVANETIYLYLSPLRTKMALTTPLKNQHCCNKYGTFFVQLGAIFMANVGLKVKFVMYYVFELSYFHWP